MTQGNMQAGLELPGVFFTMIEQGGRPQRVYWYAEMDEDGTVAVQTLNLKCLPSGTHKSVSVEEFTAKYTPDRRMYESKTLPRKQQLDTFLARADALRSENMHARAAVEYRRALAIDEENVDANFGAALTHMARGERAQAASSFKRLLRLEGTFDKKHKHVFNELGISMRKNRMLEQAVIYYRRAIEVTQNDENLYLNLARALCEQQKFAAAVRYIIESLKVAPGNQVAVTFITWLRAQRRVPIHLNADVSAALRLQPKN